MTLRLMTIVFVATLFGLPAQAEVREAATHMVPGGNALPIALTQWGNTEGPGILFIHGFLASTLNWEKQIKADLGKTYNLASVDMRGHGASAKPDEAMQYQGVDPWAGDIAGAIKAAGFTKPVLVAWSYGAFFVMDYVRKFGTSNIGGIVLVGTTGGLIAPPPKAEITPERQKQIDRNTSPNLDTIIDWTNGFLGFLTSDGPLPADELDKIRISALLVPHYVRPYLRQHSNDNSDMGPKLNVPVLFIAGTKDNSLKVADLHAAAKTVANASIREYENMGTMTFWYAPERFDRDVAEFAAMVQERSMRKQ